MRISDWSSDVCSSDLVTDRLVIAVAGNAGKRPLFSAEERVEMVRDDVASMDTHGAEVQVRAFDNLLIQFCHEVGASLMVRGLRAVSAYANAYQMAAMHRRSDARMDTGFTTADTGRPKWRRRVERYGGE